MCRGSAEVAIDVRECERVPDGVDWCSHIDAKARSLITVSAGACRAAAEIRGTRCWMSYVELWFHNRCRNQRRCYCGRPVRSQWEVWNLVIMVAERGLLVLSLRSIGSQRERIQKYRSRILKLQNTSAIIKDSMGIKVELSSVRRTFYAHFHRITIGFPLSLSFALSSARCCSSPERNRKNK